MRGVSAKGRRNAAAPPGPLPGRRGRLARDERGSAIVEMAIVATPFLLLLMATIEQGIILYKHEVLLTAVSDAARLVRTGQANSAGYTQEQFRQQVCAKLPTFIGCSTVSVDVRPYSSFATARPYQALDTNGNYNPALMQYDIGGSGSIMVVSAVSIQQVMFPMLNPFYSSAGSGNIRLTAQAAFRNEPF